MKTIGLILLVCLGLNPLFCGPATAAGVRDLTPEEYATTLRLIMEGSRAASVAHLDALADSCTGQPLYLLARARVQLEAIPIDDDDKAVTTTISEPGFAMLDEVIAACDAGLKKDGGDLRLRYYRGWAWMMKSQFKAFGRNFYSAGRDAGKGKNDLEAYLKAYPTEPIPNGLLGAYLYFTDAVPKLFQFLSKLLFLPTGDRDRGLEMIRFAVAGDSPARVDYEVLDANVTFFFEGRYVNGLGKSTELLERYPAYPRLALSSAFSAPLDPIRASEHQAIVTGTLARLEDDPSIDTASLATLEVIHAWSLRSLAGHDAARAALQKIVTDPPVHPDWGASFARLQLAWIDAAEGRPDLARTAAEQIRADEAGARFHDLAKNLLDDLKKFADYRPDGMDEDLITAIYSGSPDSLAAMANALDPLAATSIRAAFYAAECRLLMGDTRAAKRGYRELHGRKAPAWDEVWRMLAAARVGEITAASGNWRSAANWLGRAAESHQEVYRLEWLLQGRQRLFEEIGEAQTGMDPPTLLAPAP